MSDAHNEHETVIKTPKQLVVAVVAAFIVPIICILLLIQYVTAAKTEGAGSGSQSSEAVATRIQPIADANFSFKDASGPKQLQAAADIYKATCAACHATGAAGAPKVGDNTAWAKRIAQGYAMLVTHATKGLGAMPAKGGNPELEDIEIASTVVFMANQSGAKFKEPDTKATSPTAESTGGTAK